MKASVPLYYITTNIKKYIEEYGQSNIMFLILFITCLENIFRRLSQEE